MKLWCLLIVCLLSAPLLFAQQGGGGFSSNFKPLDYTYLRKKVVDAQANMPVKQAPTTDPAGQRAANTMMTPKPFVPNGELLDYAGLRQAVLNARIPTYSKAMTAKSLEIHPEKSTGDPSTASYSATPASRTYAASRKK